MQLAVNKRGAMGRALRSPFRRVDDTLPEPLPLPPEGAGITPDDDIVMWHTLKAGVVPSITMIPIFYPEAYQGDSNTHCLAASIGGVTFALIPA